MIVVEGLVKRHGVVEVLRGVDLAVAKGDVACLIGPSGGGKSTFLRCLNGLERFQAGRVAIGDLELTAEQTPAEHARAARRVCRRMGMVFQAFNLFAHQTVLQNVIEAPVQVLGMGRNEAVERARALLDRVGMADRLDARPRELSGGQQQRVAIARALAMGPEVMLFDEPTSALDPRMTGEVLGVMTDLARDGQTMIVVTHAMGFARKVASVVHVFGEGRVVESGEPGRVFDAPAHEATRSLLAEVRAA
ncbi:amino acid ABC transporter ATP-binding protein [Paludisphaera soli]|uniref:amino acid ABC transporter ATP-binding protein n=1 Tax=Paludisphaera soli TaxID=2712865 RepID=UPI0013EB4357|nr:amino acid ABC transporter ATP-binding protein [Paludisphaera soli]